MLRSSSSAVSEKEGRKGQSRSVRLRDPKADLTPYFPAAAQKERNKPLKFRVVKKSRFRAVKGPKKLIGHAGVRLLVSLFHQRPPVVFESSIHDMMLVSPFIYFNGNPRSRLYFVLLALKLQHLNLHLSLCTCYTSKIAKNSFRKGRIFVLGPQIMTFQFAKDQEGGTEISAWNLE